MIYNKELYPFKSRWINIQGNQIHYIDEGQGTPILFCHPPLGSSFMYRHFIRVLSKTYRCIAPDFPGFGASKSAKTYQFNIFSQSQILIEMIQQLHLEDLVVLGHDTGGPSAFYAMAQIPERLKALIVTDTIIFPTEEYPRIHRMLKIVGTSLFRTVNERLNLLVFLTFNFGVTSRKLSKAEKRSYYDLFDNAQKRKRITDLLVSLKNSPDLMKEVKRAFSEQLNSTPTLLIYGENDPVYKLGIADRIHKLMPKSELFLVEKEGHFPHEEQPELMSKLIGDWMNKMNF